MFSLSVCAILPLVYTAHVASRILLSQCEYKTRASGTCCLLTKDNLSGVFTFPPLIFLAQGNGVSHILLLLKISLQFSQCHSLREYITRLVYLMTIKTISMIKTKQRKRKGKKKKSEPTPLFCVNDQTTVMTSQHLLHDRLLPNLFAVLMMSSRKLLIATSE